MARSPVRISPLPFHNRVVQILASLLLCIALVGCTGSHEEEPHLIEYESQRALPDVEADVDAPVRVFVTGIVDSTGQASGAVIHERVRPDLDSLAIAVFLSHRFPPSDYLLSGGLGVRNKLPVRVSVAVRFVPWRSR